MTSLSRKEFEVAIIGGGIAGVTLAISLSKRNVPCIIYEKAGAFTEIGAGLGITPNATRAMKACDLSVYQAFDRVAQPSIRWDFLDGSSAETDDVVQFSLGDNEFGIRGCHRAHFLEGMVESLPGGITRFNKELARVEEPHGPSGKLQMVFSDGSTAETDAIVGCDGIKSRTREFIVGRGHPSTKCSFTNKYCYRGLIPIRKGIEILGQDRAMGSNLWFAEKVHIVTYPVAKGTILNAVMHCTSKFDWPSDRQFVLPAQQDDAYADSEGLSPRLRQVVKNMRTVDRWGLFDLGEHPMPAFAQGRICVIGDAAHASTPHQGAGAGFCIEDAAVLASLVADNRVKDRDGIKAAFAAFDACRRQRGHRLVEGSRRAGELYEGRTEVGNDLKEIEREIRMKSREVWEFDINKNIDDGLAELGRRLAVDNEAVDYRQGSFRAGL